MKSPLAQTDGEVRVSPCSLLTSALMVEGEASFQSVPTEKPRSRQVTMNTLIWVFLLGTGLHDAAARTHSLKIFLTASSGVSNLPEFLYVGFVDDVPITYYDSNTRRTEPKQDWVTNVTADDPDVWERESMISLRDQQWSRVFIEDLKQRFNHTGGVHLLQAMGGCEWDDETGEVTGFHQLGYDGEDFIVLDLKTETWVATRHQALLTKHKWDNDKAGMEFFKHRLTQECPDWLKKFVNYRRSYLLRTDLPSVSLLQKTPSSPVSCHATGFYPDEAAIFWSKDGEELHEDVEHGEILPNHDGTFQMSVDLDLSSVSPEDCRRYDCVFQLLGVEDDIITRLDKEEILTNWEEPVNVSAIVGAAVVVLALVLVAAAVGFKLYQKKKGAVGGGAGSPAEHLPLVSPEPAAAPCDRVSEDTSGEEEEKSDQLGGRKPAEPESL